MKQQLSRIKYLSTKALYAVPECVLKPSQLVSAARGAHWATLNTLDKPWIRQFRCKTVLDVGANTGQFLSAAQIVFPDARLYSFEPAPGSYEVLSQRFGKDKNVFLYPFAVGNCDSQVTLNLSAFSEASSILNMADAHIEAFPWTETLDQIIVPMRTLDSFLREIEIRRPSLLKIDVQGAEGMVLEGAKDSLSMIDLAVIETSFVDLYDGEPGFDHINEVMQSHGFRFQGVLDSLLHPTTGRMLQFDAVFHR